MKAFVVNPSENRREIPVLKHDNLIHKTPKKYRRPVGRGNTKTEVFDLDTFCEEYRPVDEPRWNEVDEFVRSGVKAGDPASYPHAHRMTRALTRHGLYCIDEGVLLDPEEAMHPDRVEAFVASQLKGSTGCAQDYLGDLRRAGRQMTTKAPYRSPLRVSRRSSKDPYTGVELQQLHRVIETQSTEMKKQSGLAMYFLGVACGLDGRWVTHVGPGDLACTTSGDLVVSVRREPTRLVPVDPTYAVALKRFAEGVTTEKLVGKHSTSANRVTALVKGILIPPGAPSLNLGRLRSTWLANHLVQGTPLPHLLEAAGLETLTSLGPLLPIVAERVGPPTWRENHR